MDQPRKIFLDLVLNGARFDEGGVPVDTLEEFRRYRELVLDVARALFFAKNPDRKRVPRGFNDQFELQLTAVKEGSAIGQLSRASPSQDPILPGMASDVFAEASDLINDCIEAISQGDSIPQSFPPELLRHFKYFGKTLRDGESMEFRRTPETRGPRLDKSVRQQIVRSLGDDYEEETVLTGRLVDVDTKNGTFGLEDEHYGVVTCKLPREDEQRVLRVHRCYRAVGLRVSGTGLFSSEGILKSLHGIDHIDEEDLGVDFQARIDHLRTLEDGWFDGAGASLRSELFEQITGILSAAIYEYNTYVPHLYPTPEGGLQAEWQLPADTVEVEFTPEGKVELLAHHKSSDRWTEKEYSLEQSGLAKSLADFVNGLEQSG